MKTKSFISFAVCVAVSVLMCSCSNEESADSIVMDSLPPLQEVSLQRLLWSVCSLVLLKFQQKSLAFSPAPL